MLNKMFKYDFRAMSRPLLPVQFTVLGGSILASILLTVNIRNGFGDNALGTILKLFSISIIAVLCIAIFASMIVTFIMIAKRLFESTYGDEGYFMMTIPVSTEVNMFSKLSSALLWFIINVACVVVAVVIIVLFGTASEGIINLDITKGLGELSSHMPGLISDYAIDKLISQFIYTFVAGTIYSVMLIYFSCILGGTIGKKNKGGCAVGMFFAITAVVSTLSSIVGGIVTTAVAASGVDTNSLSSVFTTITAPATISSVVLSLGLSVAMFFIGRALLKNRLNLE